MIRQGSVVAASIVWLLAAPDAGASEDGRCGRGTRPWVRVESEELAPSLGESFVALLRAELAPRGFELCSSGGPGAPVATVRVSSRPDVVALTVEVRDAMTDKRVSRDVSLASIPPDGRPLTIALSADELLRASWAELALRTAPPPAMEIPEPVALTVRQSLPSAEAVLGTRHVELGVGFVWESYEHGLTLYGADARLGAWLWPRFELVAQVGLRNGPATVAPNGTAQPSAWSVSAAALFTLTPVESRWGLDAVASIGTEVLTLAPSPVGGATGSSQSGVALLTALGAQGSFAILPGLRAGAEALLLLPLRGVDGQDGGRRFVGLSGAGWAGQVGIWSAL